MERGVATSRLLPVAFACIIGALTCSPGPTGIASVGALLVAIGPLRTILHRRSRQFGLPPLLALIMAAATVTIILIFRDQTLVGEVQANMLKSAVGPSLSWFDEHIRYERLFMASPDGSIARRFAVLALLVALAVSVAMMLRRATSPAPRAVPAAASSASRSSSFLAMMFTPTSGRTTSRVRRPGRLAGCAGGGRRHRARAAVQTQPRGVRRPGAVRHRVVVRQRQRLVVRIQLRCPVVEPVPEWHFGFTTMLLGLTVVTLVVAAWFHFSGRAENRPVRSGWWSKAVGSPLAVVAWLLVFFEVLSLTLAMIDQYPAWSVAGPTCRRSPARPAGWLTT